MEQIGLGWTLRCHDEAQLAARIEAYVDTKAAILEFKWCLENREKSSQPLPDLPPEIRLMIDASLRDMAYQTTRPWCFFAKKCTFNLCGVLDHFTKDELARADPRKLESPDEHMWNGSRVRHEGAVDSYLTPLMSPVSHSHHSWRVERFFQCRKVSTVHAKDPISFHAKR